MIKNIYILVLPAYFHFLGRILAFVIRSKAYMEKVFTKELRGMSHKICDLWYMFIVKMFNSPILFCSIHMSTYNDFSLVYR